MSILSGPVAFIDDEIHDMDKPAFAMRRALEDDGRPVSSFRELPDTSVIAHWSALSFLVLDWDLSPGSLGAMGASTLSNFERNALFDFLEEVMQRVFCPVFIVSAENIDDINRQLREDGRFSDGGLDTRLKIFSKEAVAEDLIQSLEAWVQSSLTLSVLKVWEEEYDRAKNKLFIDFNSLDSSWPVYVWQNALEDKIEPSFELATTLTANLLHRIDLVKFDTETILAASAEKKLKSSSMRKVLNGRTVIPGTRLHDNVVMPGDLFADAEDSDLVWLNLTPACHTVPGRVTDGGDVRLLVVPGRKKEHPGSKGKFNELTKESPNGVLIHALRGEDPYKFDFKAAEFRYWREISGTRSGRLLSPYVTRAQQAYAMFMQIEGVPRTSFSLYEPES